MIENDVANALVWAVIAGVGVYITSWILGLRSRWPGTIFTFVFVLIVLLVGTSSE